MRLEDEIDHEIYHTKWTSSQFTGSFHFGNMLYFIVI
jgi:hypothetical protein